MQKGSLLGPGFVVVVEDELLNQPRNFGRGWLLVSLPSGHLLQFIHFFLDFFFNMDHFTSLC